MDDERMIRLEVRVAHQDALIAALDDVVRDFATRVERLERQLDELRRAGGGEAAPPIGPQDDPPPHY